jgi:hypothetical protein
MSKSVNVMNHNKKIPVKENLDLIIKCGHAVLHLTIGLAAVLEFIARPAQTVSPIKLFKVQITNKSPKEILLQKLLLIANKIMRVYSSASIAVKPLCCVLFFIVLFIKKI